MTSTSDARSGNADIWTAATVGAAVLLIAVFIGFAWRSATAALAEFHRQRDAQMASESRTLCEKWGMAAGTPRFIECFADVQRVRDRHEQRIREDEEPY